MKMKNTWSVLWRIFALQLIVTVPAFLIVQSSGVISDSNLIIMWKPTMVYAFMAVVLLLTRLRIKDGALSKIWGYRLRADAKFWRNAQVTLVALYICLAVANPIVAYALPLTQWVTYKMWAPLAIFILVSALLARQLSNEPNRSSP